MRANFVLALLTTTALAGCATFKPPQINFDDIQPASLQQDDVRNRFCAKRRRSLNVSR